MDIDERDKFRPERTAEDSINDSHSMSSDWQFGQAILTSMPMDLVLPGNVDIVRNQDMVSCSSSTAPLVESFSPAIWEQAANSQNLGFGNAQDHNHCITPNAIAINKASGYPVSLSSGIDRTLDISWNLSHGMLKGGVYLPNIPGVLPPSLSQLPADSSFIERAARFSSFSGGNFGDVLGPFSMPDSVGVFSRGVGIIPGRRGDFPRNGLSSVPGSGAEGQSQTNELNRSEPSKAVSLTNELGATERSPSKNESSSKWDDHGKRGVDGSVDESEEAEFSGGDGSGEPCMLEVTGGELSAKGSRKRKRSGQKTELDQANGPLQQTSEPTKNNTDIQQKGDQPSSTTIKDTGKHGKQGSQPSDVPKEEYLHVRARRGQATNSHSLAERVRREKISERMKFLQELVPGCSKVTGKAVMLDEIINYVQSLQRQVEFLSMKLATVNPRLDINIEGLLAKDILQSRAGPSSTLGLSPHMPVACPPPHFSHHGLIPASFPATTSSEMLRSTINSQLTPRSGGFKEPTHTQIKNSWDGELQNIVQMNFGTSAPSNCLEIDGSETKVEF